MHFDKLIRPSVGADKSAPTDGWMILFICIIGTYGFPRNERMHQLTQFPTHEGAGNGVVTLNKRR